MEELRVPTTQIEAELQLDDARILRGTVFVPAASSHAGAKRPDEWINEPAAFYPFLIEGRDTPEIFSKQATLRLSVAAELLHEEEQPAHVEHRKVLVETAAGSFEGVVRLDMPSHQRRVLDYVNLPQPFLCVVAGATAHLIQKRLMKRIVESD
jgi:hypothetical protein